MTDSDVETVKTKMEECTILTDSDSGSDESMDWVLVGAGSDSSSSIDCVSEDDFLMLQDHQVDSLRVLDDEATAYAGFSEHLVRKKKEITIADVVMVHVLPLLPAKSLCRFRSVCKAWDAWISSPFLAHKQTLHFRQFSGLFFQYPATDSTFFISVADAYGIPDPSMEFLPFGCKIRSSCNGLICCQGPTEDGVYYICNPVTRQWKDLPDPKYYHGPDAVPVLAFSPSTFNFNSNYELACAIPMADAGLIVFEIFSSRSCCWRASENVCTELGAAALTSNAFYSSGIAYWETECGFLLALDLRTEQYGIIKLPEGSGPHCALTEVHGELCYVMPGKGDYRVLIYSGMNMSLKFMVNIELGHLAHDYYECFQVVGCMNNGDIMLILVEGKLIAYHTGGKTAYLLSSYLQHSNPIRFFPYVNSLVNVHLSLPEGDPRLYMKQ